MQRIVIPERVNWRKAAREYGFGFHTLYGEPYWDESAYYRFSLTQIERDLEAPTAELHQMCLAAVEVVINSEYWLDRFCIPPASRDLVRGSWRRGDRSLYSRLDLAYDGSGPAKLLENNADTPTSLYETGFWQWLWLEDRIAAGLLPPDADQFNSLQDKLAQWFEDYQCNPAATPLYFSCCRDTDEDRGTVQYLEDCARSAGVDSRFIYIEDIGRGAGDVFTDLNDRIINAMFKLYPWEFMLREDFAPLLHKAEVTWIEPPWKAILSNKALLPLLWQLYPDHPNLLPACFADDPGGFVAKSYVKKPIFAREGANVDVVIDGVPVFSSPGPYGEEGFIYQAYTPLPQFSGNHMLVGSWLVDDQPAGISVREDRQMVTQDLSRYLPHAII